MTFSEVFTRMGKLVAAYANLTAVSIRVEDGLCSVRGLGAQRAFGFRGSLPDDSDTEDFYFIAAPEKLKPAFSLIISGVSIHDGSLVITGALSSDEGAPMLKVTCTPAGEALAQQVTALDNTVERILAEVSPATKLCALSDVLTPWQSLAKCGRRLFLTPNMTYALSASVAAFYDCDNTYANLEIPEGKEPPQVDSTYPVELQAVGAACGTDDLFLGRASNGMVFMAASEDKSVFALSCASVPQKHTLPKAMRFYADASKFTVIKLPQSAVRDVLVASADKLMVEVESSDVALSFKSGVRGIILTEEAIDLDCDCEVSREHAVQALAALSVEDDLLFGYGQSGGQMFVSFEAADVLLLIPAQDTTEV